MVRQPRGQGQRYCTASAQDKDEEGEDQRPLCGPKGPRHLSPPGPPEREVFLLGPQIAPTPVRWAENCQTTKT